MSRKVVIVVAAALAAVATGASAQTRGVTNTDIVLGMHTDLSGVAATYGVSSSNGVKMRFDDINDGGGINGRKLRLIEHQLTAEDEEVTPTLKLKRKFVNEKYKAMIDGMYAEAV